MSFFKNRGVFPGFGLSLGYTLFYLGLVVLIPLSTLFVKTASLTGLQFWETVTSPRVMASFRLTFGASLVAALVNTVFGLWVAWVLTRYEFPGRRLLDGLVDLPFALPTSVAGIALTTLYAPDGWLGRPLAVLGIEGAFSRFGIVIALTFIGLPFVVRTLQPVLEDMDPHMEEAAQTLGAGRWMTVTRVILPPLLPALITGFSLSFARAIGEYGSVVFISGNQPFKTEITPLLIVTKLEQHDIAGATALAVVLLVTSFLLLLTINGLQAWARRRHGESA
jgi:sulfate transport system permease protein